MMKAVVIILLILSFTGCKTIKYVPLEGRSDSIVIEKLVPVELPSDSTTIKALLECDENGKLILKLLDIANGKNAKADFIIDSLGNVIARMKVKPDTIYIPNKKEKVSEKEQIPVLIEKKLTVWQQVKVSYGGYAILVVFLFFTYRVVRLVLALKKKFF